MCSAAEVCCDDVGTRTRKRACSPQTALGHIVLWCAQVTNNSFNVNILKEGADGSIVKALVKNFAPGEDRFAAVEHRRSDNECVVLEGGVSCLQCKARRLRHYPTLFCCCALWPACTVLGGGLCLQCKARHLRRLFCRYPVAVRCGICAPCWKAASTGVYSTSHALSTVSTRSCA